MSSKQRIAGLMTDLETSQARVIAVETELSEVKANMVATGHANSALQVQRSCSMCSTELIINILIY